jgi:twitching motility protein PilU
MEKDASDLYLSADAPPRFSLHGEMVDAADFILSAPDTLTYAQEIMTEKQRVEFDNEKEINFALKVGEEGRFRVNVFTQRDTVALVIRRIKVSIQNSANLGFRRN